MGLHLIQTLKNIAVTARQAASNYHNKWYSEALTLADKVHVQEGKPICHRQVKPLVKRYKSPARTSSISTISKNCSTFDSIEPEMVLLVRMMLDLFEK